MAVALAVVVAGVGLVAWITGDDDDLDSVAVGDGQSIVAGPERTATTAGLQAFVTGSDRPDGGPGVVTADPTVTGSTATGGDGDVDPSTTGSTSTSTSTSTSASTSASTPSSSRSGPTTTRSTTGSTARPTNQPTTTRPTTQTSTTQAPTTRATTDQPTTSRAPTTARPTTTTPTTTASTTTTRPTTTTTRATTTTGGGDDDPGSGTVVWEDTFDRLDPSTWRLEHSTYGDGNNELQCYQPDNVAVRDGKLVLSARTETVTCPGGSTRQVSSGMVRSRGVTFSPGQAIEFRVKLTPADPDDQGGLWPAVWSSSWAGSWPLGGELDYLEVMTAEDPTRAMFSMHYAGPDGSHALQNRGVRGGVDFSEQWHTIRFDYGEGGRLRWYLDGVLGFSVDAADTRQGYPAPFDQAIGEIKINLALGGRPGPLAAGAVGSTGATFEVDYIRIIQL